MVGGERRPKRKGAREMNYETASRNSHVTLLSYSSLTLCVCNNLIKYGRYNKKMSGQFWFPFMKYDEIIEAFQEWGMSVSEHSLRSPTPDFVTTVYAACLQQVTSLNEAAFQPVVQRSLQQLDNPVSSVVLRLLLASRSARTCTRLHWPTTSSCTICKHSVLSAMKETLMFS
jgi:hypothetical protein